MPDDEEQRSKWEFLIGEAGWTWTVKHPDGAEKQSTQAFRTLKECADDAREHGYAVWKAGERRSVDVKPFSGL